MPRYTTSQTYTDGNTQIVALPEGGSGGGANSQIVEFRGDVASGDGRESEDLEEKLRRISDQVPVRISNTSGSSAGSGSGDFHQYRQMRRREQDRLARMDFDYQKRTEEAEFLARREERMQAAEERTAKKRAKRQKKKDKQRKKRQVKAGISGEAGDGKADIQQDQSSEEGDSDDGKRTGLPPLPNRVDRQAVATPHIFVRRPVE